MNFIKVVILTFITITGFFALFTPLNAFLPEIGLAPIPKFYQQYSIWYIFMELHLKLTIMVLVIAIIISGFLTAWRLAE